MGDEPAARKVLVVEDHLAAREALLATCARLGFQAIGAASVAEGIAALMQDPHVLVVDLILPDGSGTDIVRRARCRGMTIKIAVVTGASDPLIEKEVFDLRPDAFFGKPIDLADFEDWLAQAK